MEARITRWKRPVQAGPDIDAMARLIAERLEKTFGRKLLPGPLLDQILRQAREMIAEQVEESVGEAMFAPPTDLVFVEEEEEEEEDPPPFTPVPFDNGIDLTEQRSS